MTDETSPPPVPAPPAPAEIAWQALPVEARNLSMGVGLIVGLIPCLPVWLAGVLPLVDGWGLRFALGAGVFAFGASFGAWVGYRRWISTFWRLDARGLQVRRGRMFFREVFVPRSRVQHLDIERGPIERHAGLATVVVHTAGSRMQALRQSGLREADAVALRDALVPEADTDDDAV
jgi:membrane protein YdbS with pleckstrin-like domain